MRYLVCIVKKLVILSIGMATLFFVQIKFAETKGSILHFPENRSMGMLYVLDSDKVDTDKGNYNDSQVLCEATGKVTVSSRKALRLDLRKKGGNDLSPLSLLESNDLTMLYCFRS